MIDHPVKTNDYNIPQIEPKPAEPTQFVVEPLKPLPAPAAPPPLEAIKEEPELESDMQESEQDRISMIPVEENLSAKINKNKLCINNCLGIEIADSECDNDNIISTNPETKDIYIPNPHSNPQINNYSDIKQSQQEVLEMPQSVNKDQSSQELPPHPAASSELELEIGSRCIIVEAEVHDY